MKTASLIVDVILKLSVFFVVGVFGDGVNSGYFTKFTSLKCKDGAACATSSPARSFPVKSPIQCSVEGQSKRYLPQTFVGVNYREQNKVCEMFSANPISFAYNVQGCQYWQKEASTAVRCAGINECQTNNGGCSLNATCTNNQGSITCTCKVGFAGNGFQCSVPMQCVQGTTLTPTSTSGTIASMNYPNNYINFPDCSFLITASSPYTVVRLTFTAFCTDINNVYVGVYNGINSFNPELMSTSGCVGIPGPVTTTQPSMFVRLYSSGDGLLFSGFSATYTMQ